MFITCVEIKLIINIKKFLLEQQFVRNSHVFQYTAIDCNNLLTLDSVDMCNIAKCSCGNEICWKCKKEVHLHLLCYQIKKWNDIINCWNDFSRINKILLLHEKN